MSWQNEQLFIGHFHLEPILRLLSTSRAFFKIEENIFVFKTSLGYIRGVVKFYSDGVVTHDRRFGSCLLRVGR
jgi:hypothetical protein